MLLVSLFIVFNVYAQKTKNANLSVLEGVSKVDSLYAKADSFFSENKFDEAEVLYRKIIAIDSLNTNSLYNLGVVKFKQKKIREAVEYFQSCAALGDKDAINVVKNTFHQEIGYRELMDRSIVDTLPRLVLSKRRSMPIFDKSLNKMNPKFTNKLTLKILKSGLIGRNMRSVNLIMGFTINKRGELTCSILSSSETEKFNSAVKKLIEKSFKFIPAIYKGKSVGVINLFDSINLSSKVRTRHVRR